MTKSRSVNCRLALFAPNPSKNRSLAGRICLSVEAYSFGMPNLARPLRIFSISHRQRPLHPFGLHTLLSPLSCDKSRMRAASFGARQPDAGRVPASSPSSCRQRVGRATLQPRTLSIDGRKLGLRSRRQRRRSNVRGEASA